MVFEQRLLPTLFLPENLGVVGHSGLLQTAVAKSIAACSPSSQLESFPPWSSRTSAFHSSCSELLVAKAKFQGNAPEKWGLPSPASLLRGEALP